MADSILRLHGWTALAVVFLVPALEASAFLGFVFPGEIAVLLGGVLASQGRVSLGAAIAAAVLGAVVGDSAGYLIGRRWGRALLHGTVGRLPIVKRHLDRHLDAAQAYVRRRRGSAVFFGRFTAALRVLVPGLAGMSHVDYSTFLAYNVAGGALWGGGFVLLGYLGGAWVRGRFPRQVAWLGRRLEPATPRGFPLTFAVAVAALAAWFFGGLTQDVVGHDEMALVDPKVTFWLLAHRVGWLTGAMKASTWLGSTAVIVPLGLAIGGWFLVRRRDWRPLAMLAVTVGGAIVTYDIVKPPVGRARPPASAWIGHYTGFAFPSGHATQAVAFYAMAAIVLGASFTGRRRVISWGLAVAAGLIVGFSRLYLGAHWLSDVLAGYALGIAWVALVSAIRFATSRSRSDSPVERGELPRSAEPKSHAA